MLKSFAAICIIFLFICVNVATARKQNNTAVEVLSWSPDGTKIATGNTNGDIEIWSVETGALVSTLQGHSQEVMTLRWSPDGTRIASGSPDGRILIWDVSNVVIIQTIQFAQPNGALRAINDLDWSPNGEYIATAFESGEIIIWESPTGKEVAKYSHNAMATTVAWNPSGNLIASGGLDGRVLIQDMATQSLSEFAAISPKEAASVFSLAWDSSGENIAIGSGRIGVKITAQVFNFATQKLVFQLPIASNQVISVQWSPNDKDLAITTRDEVTIVDSSTGSVEETIKGNGTLSANNWSRYGGRFAIKNSTYQSTLGLTGVIQIVTPNPSIEKLESISQMCGVKVNVQQSITADQLQTFTTQISALTDAQLPAGCKADLLAVANALIAKPQ